MSRPVDKGVAQLSLQAAAASREGQLVNAVFEAIWPPGRVLAPASDEIDDGDYLADAILSQLRAVTPQPLS